VTTTAAKKSDPRDVAIRLQNYLSEERCAVDVDSSSKKRTFEYLSEQLAAAVPSLDPREIFECLINRERLGTTALGKGIAIPHGRVAGIEQPVAAFIRLRQSIDCDAVDRQPVDLMFALLVPEASSDQHLQILAHLARLFSDDAFTTRLRQAESAETMYQLLINHGTEAA
jgi:PTS system nitrogen regulatory IIA component